ncbi:alpha/beta fold hydrolase [Smaragdicoccus niigatensis]|uniref:alpha/beta fold hydrolase n=1 Tax=Smaragdicoccus niigatensis TaxID=359359 RepID=UPI00058FB030|nr:alpha/beta hydrolase [Smaragdicoccus niigatensis]
MPAKPPLLLLHGVTMSAATWDEVAPLLADEFDLIVPTAAGHRGGPTLAGAATIKQLVDVTEKLLDDRGLSRVHMAGNSMGGWMAIELARRGRARSVCALSPAGFWDRGTDDELGATNTLIHAKRLAELAKPVAPVATWLPAARKLMLRDIAEHGDRLSHAQALTIINDLVDCPAAAGLFTTPENVEPMKTLPCPITLAWSEKDRLFPPAVNGAIAQQRIPGAQYFVIPGVGHVPMIDDPNRCAEIIRAAIKAAESDSN